MPTRRFWVFIWLVGLGIPALIWIFVIGNLAHFAFLLGCTVVVCAITYVVWRFANRNAKPS